MKKSTRSRLTEKQIAVFPGNTLFDKIARAVCRAGTLPGKELFEVAPVNRAVLDSAVSSDFKDFEDAVVHESALYKEAQGIVTRDLNGFKQSKIYVYSPEELLLMLESKSASPS